VQPIGEDFASDPLPSSDEAPGVTIDVWIIDPRQQITAPYQAYLAPTRQPAVSGPGDRRQVPQRRVPRGLQRRMASVTVGDSAGPERVEQDDRREPGGEDPFAVWREMREREGPRVTLIRLYALVAERRGLKPHELPLAERRELVGRATPLMWAGFEYNERSKPRERQPVDVVAYDQGWPERFEAWRGRLAELLGPVALRIEHVGSTSVPGLAAKPVVDIQVSVVDLSDEDLYVPPCEATGLQFRLRDDEHRYFQPPPGKPRDVHVHVCQQGSRWERVHLLFRDYLRFSADAREAYAAAKCEAARLWGNDRPAYTEAKTDVILGILDQAEAWATATGWAIRG
jgi:GrpB-like predicted nucleotidyltransferase (UPF0157 family)